MMMLLHNPRCSKSRAAVALLERYGVEHTVRKYLDEPLSLDELRILKQKLGREPAEWIRWGQDEAKGLDKDGAAMDLLGAIAEHPILMERPILVRDDDAFVGRPDPEEVFSPLLGA